MINNQHQSIVLTRNGMRDVVAVFVDREGFRSRLLHATSHQPVAEARARAIAQLEGFITDDCAAFFTMNVLSIDAWRDPDGGWQWNNWHKVGTVTRREFEMDCGGAQTLAERRKACKWFRDNGYLSASSQGLVSVEDDGVNLIVLHRVTQQPLYAIEYAQAYD